VCVGGRWNTALDLELTGPTLITHLIREHGFFEGLESPYRVDPERLPRLLTSPARRRGVHTGTADFQDPFTGPFGGVGGTCQCANHASVVAPSIEIS
jgi:hypothetical protein